MNEKDTAALCLVIIDGGCLHTASDLSITTIELNIGDVYGLNYSERQTLCFFDSSCTYGMGIDAYLDKSCPERTMSCKQHPANKILTISDGMHFINIRLLTPNNSLDLAYVLRIGNGTEMYITVGDCSRPPFIKHVIFKQRPQLHIKSTNNSYKQQEDNAVAISFGITLPFSIIASITVTCLVVHIKKLLLCCKSKKNTSKVQDDAEGI